GNIPRVLPQGCRARLLRSSWSPPAVFETLRKAGQVEDAEMFRIFNMGIGYVVIVPSATTETAARILRGAGEQVARIGEIVAGERSIWRSSASSPRAGSGSSATRGSCGSSPRHIRARSPDAP